MGRDVQPIPPTPGAAVWRPPETLSQIFENLSKICLHEKNLPCQNLPLLRKKSPPDPNVNTIRALSDVWRVLGLIRSTHHPSKTSCEVRTVLPLVVVAAEGLAVDEGERGDDEDRMMPGAAEVMPELSPVPLL